MMKVKGFSLIEVMVAVLILALIAGGMFGIFVSGKGFVIRAGHKIEAINLARQKMEELKSEAYGSVTPGTFSDGVTVGAISATRTWTVDDTLIEGKEVTVTVEWTVAGVNRDEEIVTLIANPGP